MKEINNDENLAVLLRSTITRIEAMHDDLYGKDGIKIQVAINKTVAAALHQRLDDIERKMDRAFWFTLITSIGVIVSVVLTR